MNKHYIYILGIILCLSSCNQHTKHWETLMQVESFIEKRPQIALTVLLGIDKTALSGKEEKAKYINPLHPLSGTIIFTEYNPKNKKYKGTWHMKSINKDGDENYEIIGEFNSCIYRNQY